MDARTLARLFAAGRCVVGAAFVVAPGLAGRGWIGAVADAPGAKVLGRALGIRDLIMGAITLHVLDHPQVGPRWLASLAVADAVDCAATVAVADDLPSPAGTIAAGVAGGSALAGVALAAALRD